MTIESFWEIIARARAHSTSTSARIRNTLLILTHQNRMKTLADLAWDRRVEALSNLLSTLPPEEILQFDRIFDEQMNRAYSRNLRGAAFILGSGGCSDDSFTDFRSWLISMGRELFEKALDDPDSLAEVSLAPDPGGEPDVFFEEFAYIARCVYEKKTGQEMPSTGVGFPEEPAGDEWEYEDLPVRYPKLWEKNKHFIE
ncbi:MAG: DUF4240 domain-containing protein [Armatimonadota bacterium]